MWQRANNASGGMPQKPTIHRETDRMAYTIETGQSTITVSEGDATQTAAVVQHVGRSTITITDDGPPPEAPAAATGPTGEIELSMGLSGVVQEHNAALAFQATVLEALALDAMRETKGQVSLSLDAARLAYDQLTPDERAVRFFDSCIDDVTTELLTTPGCRQTLAKVAAQWPELDGPTWLTPAELSMSPSRRASAVDRYLQAEEMIFRKTLPTR
jgi:hypothetical protein